MRRLAFALPARYSWRADDLDTDDLPQCLKSSGFVGLASTQSPRRSLRASSSAAANAGVES